MVISDDLFNRLAPLLDVFDFYEHNFVLRN